MVRNEVRAPARASPAPSGLGSSSRALRDAARMGSVLGAAVKGHRTLEGGESRSLITFGALFLALAVVAVLLPRLIAYPIALLVGRGAGGATWRGRRAMRISVCNWRTTEEDVEQTVALVRRILD